MAKMRKLFLWIATLSLLFPAGFNPVQAARVVEPATISQQGYLEAPDAYEFIAENDTFKLYANKKSLAFKVMDTRNGYVWNSNLDQKGETDRLNKTWLAFAKSGISLDYLDAKAISKRLSITSSENTIDWKPVKGGFEATITFPEALITIRVIVKLEEAGVSVEVPYDSIRQEGDFKLGTLYVFPFLGYARADSIPGYMFIPDGSGSLIRFVAETKATNMFYGKYYGNDLGMTGTLDFDPTLNRPFKMSIPVYGMAHGDTHNAYISVVEKGASYGQMQVHPSGVITNFNFIYNAYTYNESYFQATNRSGAGVTILQHNTNAFDVLQHYRFLAGDDSDYVGMARSYQKYLLDKGVLKKGASSNKDIGIRLEFLGGDNKKVLLWKSFIPMTTIRQVDEILKDLELPNPEVVYFGWQPRGATSMPPARLKIESSLGSLSELEALVKSVKAGNGDLYLYLDPQAAKRGEGGYSLRSDLAMSITNFNLKGYNRYQLNYYLNLNALSRRYASLSQGVFSSLKAGLALDDIGSMLYSDFKNNHFINREDTIRAYQDLLAKNPGDTAFYLPNDYMYGYMKAYFDMPLTDSGYIYSSETVPFLQIVLAGYVPYYGPALNFSSDPQQDLLRQVDYGVYPSYFLTNEVTARILDTNSNWIYTSSYDQWGTEVKQTYQWLNGLLGPVKGQEITGRETLAAGVTATIYANGKQIVVNYNQAPFTYKGVQIKGKDAVIMEVQP